MIVCNYCIIMICMYVCLCFPFTTFIYSFFYPFMSGVETMVRQISCVDWKYRLPKYHAWSGNRGLTVIRS